MQVHAFEVFLHLRREVIFSKQARINIFYDMNKKEKNEKNKRRIKKIPMLKSSLRCLGWDFVWKPLLMRKKIYRNEIILMVKTTMVPSGKAWAKTSNGTLVLRKINKMKKEE
jgi:hypothetical protein